MTQSPLISVIMSVYKEPLEWIRQSIESILTQTYENFEFIIINDNPDSDDLDEFLNIYLQKDARVKVIKNPSNIGLTKSLNIGLAQAVGEYIARMDADDISRKDRFQKQINFMQSHPDVIVCGSKIKLFGKPLRLFCQTYFKDDLDIKGQLMLNSGFAHPTVMIRKLVLTHYNIRYDESYRASQDYKLWWDLSNKGKFANLPDTLLNYRISSQQVSKQKVSLQQSKREYLSTKFQERWLSNVLSNLGINKTDNLNIEKIFAENKSSLSKEDKILYAYYKRALLYKSPKTKNIFKVFFGNTQISFKERLILLAVTLKELF